MKRSLLVLSLLAIPAWAQTKDLGSGAATVGKGVASGAADVGKGTAGAVANLATGHPVGAAACLGTGLAKGGVHAAVGTGKGAGKIGRGVGVGLKKLAHL